jgi:hypothetical protein
VTPTAYNGLYVATKNTATQFQYNLATSLAAGSGASMFFSITSNTQVLFSATTGMIFRSNNAAGPNSIAALAADPSGNNLPFCIFEANTTTQTLPGQPAWLMPTNPANCAWINNDNPSAATIFGNLPGQIGSGLRTGPSSVLYGPIEGMAYNITDGLLANMPDGDVWGGRVTGGGGALHRSLYYNGTNWTIMGK